MGVSSLPNRIVYSGNGSSTTFNFPYYFFFLTDLLVFKYDTLLGGVTPFTMGVDYTIAGTANTQGLYPNGATVNTTVAPLSTDMLVIVREPPELQNYALLQNQNIASTALVQQFDYLTLLVQKLQDQVNRCIYLPDGMAPSFSGALPSTVALNPGAAPVVNSTGTGWNLSTLPFQWQSVVIPYTAFQVAGTSMSAPVFTLPAGFIIMGALIKSTIQFAGSGITSLLAGVGPAGSNNLFLNSYSLLASVSDGNFDYEMPNYLASFANPTVINCTAVSAGANLSALTAGSVTVNYLAMNSF